MIRFLRLIGMAVFLGLFAIGLLMWMGHGAGEIPPATVDFATLDDAARQDLIARGEKVAQASDCTACHADPNGGSPLGGGLAMSTPMGVIYATNITPSTKNGIGGYSADDLYRAVAWGVRPDGGNLYPAMPYVSYHAITRADSDALYAWLMAQPAVDKPNRPNALMFPFSIRPAVSIWNALFRPAARPAAPQGDSLTDSTYLVEVLGHCQECHSPRNLAYAIQGPALSGNVIEGAYAPDLRADAMARRGWSGADLRQFLREGVSPQGVMTFGMFPVLSHSTSHMEDDQLAAITGYLLGNTQPAAPAAAQISGQDQGAQLYTGLCAGCHGADGRGQPFSSVPLDRNTTAMFPDALNLVRVIREGISERDLAHGQRMQTMPAFANALDHDQMAALVTYLRSRWGGQDTPVTAADVAAMVKTINAAEAAH